MIYLQDQATDAYGIRELQDKILEIMLWIDAVCQRYEIDYCLMGGSAIGAVRHNGFIPWDDDMDIFMTVENYEKFRSLFHNRRKDSYYLQEWGACNGMVTMAKIRMDGTAYIEETFEDWDIHHGIYVDIMILHECPDNKILQLIQYMFGRYAVIKGLADRGYNRRKGLVGILLRMLASLPIGFGVPLALKNVYAYHGKDTAYYCNVLGKSNFRKSIYPRTYFENNRYVPFETVQLKVPGSVEDYLSDRFGDYMQIPSAERIKWEQHAKAYSTTRDFSSICGRSTFTFCDERKLI